MIQLKAGRFAVLIGILLVTLLTALSMTACKGGGKSQEPAAQTVAEKPPVPLEEITIDSLADVLGKAEAEKSGIFDLVKTDGELKITYHFYQLRRRRMDQEIGPEIAPKIQALYAKFKTVDRVLFQIDAFERRGEIEWKPYCTFVTTRKLIQETNWTNLLAKDFFQVVLELKYAD